MCRVIHDENGHFTYARSLAPPPPSRTLIDRCNRVVMVIKRSVNGIAVSSIHGHDVCMYMDVIKAYGVEDWERVWGAEKK